MFPHTRCLSSNAVHVIFLKKEKGSIWFNSYRVLLSNLKALRSGRDNFRVTNAYITASKHTLVYDLHGTVCYSPLFSKLNEFESKNV